MTDFLLLASIFLMAGVVAVPLASRLGFGSVLGYLIAGTLISPILALLKVDVVAIQHFAEFGVVIMLFLIGLELEPRRLWDMRVRILGLGGGQVLGSAFLIGLAAYLFGLEIRYAIAIGFILALSSTAIVLQTLNEKGLMQSDGGQTSFSVLLLQDIAVIPMLALLPLLASPELAEMAARAVSGEHGAGAEDHGPGMSLVAGLLPWQGALVSLGAVACVVLAGNYLTRPVFRYIAMAGLPELFTAFALMMVIGISLLMVLVGLSPALGTFLAGVVLANSEYRHQLEADIKPFRGLLLGLFFMTVGAGINVALLTQSPLLIIGLTLGLMTLKALVLFGLSFGFQINGSHRWLFALGLCQMGEFGFVLLSFATSNAILPEFIADQLLLVITLSMLLTPFLFIFRERVIAPRYDPPRKEQAADAIEENHDIIIAGRGRIGGIIHRILNAAGYSATAIHFNSGHLEIMRSLGFKAHFGDATRADLLQAAGIGKARILIIAIDNRQQINELVRYMVKQHPQVHVICRAIDRDHVYELWAIGCRDITRETYHSSLRMGRSALEALGIARHTADRMIEAFDRSDQASMLEVAHLYDVSRPVQENKFFIQKVRESLEQWEFDLNREMAEIRDAADK